MIGMMKNWALRMLGRDTNPFLERTQKEMRARRGRSVSRKEAVLFPPFARTITVIASTVAKYITGASVYPKDGRDRISEDAKRLEKVLWGSMDNGLHSSFEKLQADIADYLIEGYSLNLVKRQPGEAKYPYIFSPCMDNMILQRRDGFPVYFVGGKPYTPNDMLSVTFRDLMQEKRLDAQLGPWAMTHRPVPSNLSALKHPLNTGIAIWSQLEDYFGSKMAVYLVDQIAFDKELGDTTRDQLYGHIDDAVKDGMPLVQGQKGEIVPPGEIGAIISILDTLKHAVHTIHTYYGLSPLMMGTSTVERGAGLGRISDIDFSYCFEIHLNKFLAAYRRRFLSVGETLVPNRLANLVGSDNLPQVLQQLRPDPGQAVGPLATDHEIRKWVLGMPYNPDYLEARQGAMPAEEMPQLDVVGSVGEDVEDWRGDEKILAL